MESKVTDRDIHSILDRFGPTTGEELPKTEKGKTKGSGAVWFVDPLKKNNEETMGDALPLGSDEKCMNGLNEAVLVIRQNSGMESDEEEDTSTSLHNEWFDMFDSENCMVKVKELAANGRLGATSFRSLCWRLFWECLPEEKEEWLDKTAQLRKEYEVLREKYLTDPYEAGTQEDLSVNNPLSQAEDSPWHQYFQDNELRSTLRQDLDRLFPEHHFFQKSEVKKAMLHILFCFAREHPLLNYRQGMHEILACMIHVFWTDYTRIAECGTLLNESIPKLHDMKYIEHDCYHLFRHVMDVIEPWYVNVSADLEAIAKNKTSAITKKLHRIQGYMLKRYDVQLFSYLKHLDIQPQLYGIRWLRLLFGREFQLHQLPVVWDVLFSQGVTLDFTDYIYVAMLIHIRGHILKADYATCLSYLMKYPSSDDMRLIIRRAFHLRSSRPSQPQLGAKNVDGRNSPILPREHPVKARLKAGITEEQKFASALGSSPVEDNSKSYRGRRAQAPWNTASSKTRAPNQTQYKEDNGTGGTDAIVTEPEGKTEFIRERNDTVAKQGISSQLSNVFTKHKVGSPGQIIAKLTTKNKSRTKGVEVFSQLAEDHQRLQEQVSLQQREVERVCSLNVYCGEKMDAYLSILQKRITDDEPCNDETVALCLAGLKQIKEFLKGSSEFRGATNDLDIDLCDIDKHLSEALGKELCLGPSSASLEETHAEVPMPYEADYKHFEDPAEDGAIEFTTSNSKASEKPRAPSNLPPAPATLPPAPDNLPPGPDNLPPVPANLPPAPANLPPVKSKAFVADLTQPSELGLSDAELKEQDGDDDLDNYIDSNSKETDSVSVEPLLLSPTSESEILLFDKELSTISSRFTAEGT